MDFQVTAPRKGPQHGSGGGLVGARLYMHAEFLHGGFGLHHHIQQVRHGCTLVTTHVGHTRLQQRLGDGQNALAMEGIPSTQAQRFNFFGECDFHGVPFCF